MLVKDHMLCAVIRKQQKPSSVDADGNDADADFPEEDKEEVVCCDVEA